MSVQATVGRGQRKTLESDQGRDNMAQMSRMRLGKICTGRISRYALDITWEELSDLYGFGIIRSSLVLIGSREMG